MQVIRKVTLRLSLKISSNFIAVIDISECIVGTGIERNWKGEVSISICERVNICDFLRDRVGDTFLLKVGLFGSKASCLTKFGSSILSFKTSSAESAELVFR